MVKKSKPKKPARKPIKKKPPLRSKPRAGIPTKTDAKFQRRLAELEVPLTFVAEETLKIHLELQGKHSKAAEVAILFELAKAALMHEAFLTDDAKHWIKKARLAAKLKP